MNSNPTLVILTPGFPASEDDSTCLPMQQRFVRSLKSSHRHLNIIVLSFQYPFHSKPYTWNGITVNPCNGQNKGGFSRLLLRQKAYATLKKMAQENHIMGLLSFWYGECAYVGKKFGDKHGIRHRCWLLGQDAKSINKYPGRVPPREDELVALSDFLQNEFERNHGIRPALVIPPGNDSIEVDDSIVERDIDVLAAGSLIALKSYDTLLEVISELRITLPALRCKLAGDGPERQRLVELVSKSGLSGCIELTGELPHNAILGLMQRARVFLHPSSYEGFSGVCLEAIRAGAHVVSFTKPMHCPIAQWHIVQSKREMADTVLRLLSTPGTVYEKQTVFKMDETVRRIMALYE
jgi:glycosyltransferase involved in cell wall biosynthesis